MLLQELADIFSSGGPLAEAVPDYRPRQAQIELALAVEQALADRSVLVAEAGTGTGKTWAYLVPALLSGAKVLVSTGTRTLQDQLFQRDLPRLRAALALSANVALLKGRSNYLCHYHLDRLAGQESLLASRAEVRQLQQIRSFSLHTRTGDKAELDDVPEDAPLWNRVTSTRENCLGQDCPHLRDCFVLKARRRAQDADMVVVNHALFMADMVLREEGVSDLLPAVDLVIFDEAHQIPDIATRFLGSSLSSHQVHDLVRLAEAAGLAHAREATNWSECGQGLMQAVQALRLACAGLENVPGRKAAIQALPDPVAFDAAVCELAKQLDHMAERLNAVAEKHPDLEEARMSCAALRSRLALWMKPAEQGDLQEGDPSGSNVRWVELGLHHVRLHSAPLSVAETFPSQRPEDQAWVFTSATLSVRGDFGHFLRQLGLEGAVTRRWESPFDYARQALLFVPRTLPFPSAPGFAERFVELLLPAVRLARGGVLVLCTTLRAVERIADLLEQGLEGGGEPRIVLRQGQATRRALLERFRTEQGSILVGSASFWEGVDLPGDAVTLVAIDKLPFAPPDDPVLEARIRLCREQGLNPFMELQLPEAALALKQGAGRLIRSERDWGVLMVGDVRLVDKPYGKLLWRGLPPFARTRELEEMLDFLGRRQGDGNAPLRTSSPDSSNSPDP